MYPTQTGIHLVIQKRTGLHVILKTSLSSLHDSRCTFTCLSPRDVPFNRVEFCNKTARLCDTFEIFPSFQGEVVRVV